MLPELAARLDSSERRFLFVVGKGGVGKTTTAAATALYLADSGHATHLLSTDPAHSLGDVFDCQLGGEPRPSPCTPALTLEELDARGHALRWSARLTDPIAQLVERGTYLDAEDARGLAALSLPGVDEIMGALRLVELADGAAARIVVDTAPTGHALRLLDAGELVEGWVGALDSMARKARAVGSALLGVPVAAPGEQAVAELRGQVQRFRREVLGRAGFLVVTRPGDVVAAETARLLEELRRRGLALDAVLRTGGEPAPGELAVPLMAPPRGCRALRAWGEPPAAAVPRRLRFLPEKHRDFIVAWVPRASSPQATAAAVLCALPQSLFLFAGKGGVGKSTCSAAFALELARTRPTVLLGTDPAGSLADVLDVSVPSEGARAGGLEVRQVDAAAELARVQDDYRREVGGAFEALGLDGGAALDRAVLERLWSLAPPGMDELLAIVRMVRTLESGVTLVLDPAPTGHFLRLLEMPQIALDWIHALMRLILKYRLAGSLDAVARDMLQFARDLREFLARLNDPQRTAAFVVTLDEPVVAAETERLLQALAAAHVPLVGIIRNRAEAGPPSGDGGAISCEPAAGGPVPLLLLAPLVSSPPVGSEALLDFLRRWECVP